jgi:hypothetical protein
MTSIFDLKTNVNELSSSNEGTARMEYDQHPPTRDVTTNNFPNGAIHFRFQTSGQKWWIPSRSYARIRCQLAKENGDQLTLADGIAPNMGLAASLFQSMEFRINDKTVSRISDFVPQVDALETRLSKSRAWLEGIGASINFWDDDFKNRQSDVASDANNQQLQEQSKTRLELGVGATQRWAVAVDTGVATQTVDTAVDLTTIFQAGDTFELTGPKGPMKYQVVDVLTANTLQLDDVKTLAVAAGVYPWRRIRSEVVKADSTRKMINFEISWKPPLSIFKVGHALPSGKYELVLNPQTASVYQKYAIEALLGGGDKVPNTGTINAVSLGSEYIFNIVDMYLYINTVEGPRADDITYLLDLEQTRCQSESIDTTSFQQKNFDVSPSSYALTVAYQDLRAGTNAQVSSTKFKSYNAALNVSEELKLNRFFINYAGQNLPAPDADPSFTADVDYTVQRYTESQIYSGAYFDSGGGENLDEYHERGSYYYFSWPRDGTDRSTRVNVHQQFNAADVTNMRVLLFDHSKQVARIRVQDGRVVDVQVEDA